MQEARMSEQEVARRMNVEPALVRRWKFGNAYPNDMMLRRLANVLKLEVAFLSGEERANRELSQAEQRVADAEKMLYSGAGVMDTVSKLGYKDARDMMTQMKNHSKAQKYTDDEQGWFYKNVREKMREKKITSTQMSWSVGVDVTSVSNWRCGKRMPPRCLIPRISSLLGMSGRELLGGPPLPGDREKTSPPQLVKPQLEKAPVVPESSIVSAAPESAPEVEVRKEDGTLKIAVRYAADAKGKYADYVFDGKYFTVKITAPLTGLLPETLADVGEEMQKAAIAMIR